MLKEELRPRAEEENPLEENGLGKMPENIDRSDSNGTPENEDSKQAMLRQAQGELNRIIEESQDNESDPVGDHQSVIEPKKNKGWTMPKWIGSAVAGLAISLGMAGVAEKVVAQDTVQRTSRPEKQLPLEVVEKQLENSISALRIRLKGVEGQKNVYAKNADRVIENYKKEIEKLDAIIKKINPPKYGEVWQRKFKYENQIRALEESKTKLPQNYEGQIMNIESQIEILEGQLEAVQLELQKRSSSGGSSSRGK